MRRGTGVGEPGPLRWLERDLAALPCAAPDLHRRLQQSELVRPGREAALAAEAIELRQHRHQRVVGALQRDVVESPPRTCGTNLALRMTSNRAARRSRACRRPIASS